MNVHGQYIWAHTLNNGFSALFCRKNDLWFRDLMRRNESDRLARVAKRKKEMFLAENINEIKEALILLEKLDKKDTNMAMPYEFYETIEAIKEIVNNQ